MKKLSFVAVLLAICTMMFVGCGRKDGVKVITDNAQPHLMPLSLFPPMNDSIRKVYEEMGGIPSSISVIYLHKDGKDILFDTGMGADDSQLIPALKKMRLSPEDIDSIFITHTHKDHIGGLVDEGAVIFPNAELYVPMREWQVFSDTTKHKKNKYYYEIADGYRDRLRIFNVHDSLPCAIEALPAYGHTYGHTIYSFDDCLVVGDLMHAPDLQLQYPQCCAMYDENKAFAAKTRRSIIDMARNKQLKMYGMHFPGTEPIIFQ